MGQLTPEVYEELRRIGREFTPHTIEQVRRLLTPLHEASGYLAPRIKRDLAYGPDPRHRLDVHGPDGADGGLPVLLFVHGGGFTGGDKSSRGSPYYDNVGSWAARHGIVAVVMTYRLAPAHRWPAGAHDIAAALAWTRKNVADHGGDPGRIVLMGQSAGAAHVGSFLAGHGGAGSDGHTEPDILSGAVLLSGLYDPQTAEQNERLHAYYGSDPAHFPARSSVAGLADCAVPMLIGVAELDTADFHRQAVELLQAMVAAHGVFPPFVTVPDHTHLSEIFALGLDDAAFGSVLARFVHRVTTTQPVPLSP